MSAESDVGPAPPVASTSLHTAPRKPHNVAVGLKSLFSSTHFTKAPTRENGKHRNSTTDGHSAFTLFRMQQRFSFAEKGENYSSQTALNDWKALPTEQREHFEREAYERRRMANAQALAASCGEEAETANGSMLQKLREQSTRQAQTTAKVPSVSRLGPLSEATNTPKSKRHRKEDPVDDIKRPVFPQRREAHSCIDKVGRRHEIVGAIRANTENISISSSHDVSLREVSARLDAPTLSCDWQQHAGSDSEADDCRLEVDMPEGANARTLMDEQVRRKISASQVRRLVHQDDMSEGANARTLMDERGTPKDITFTSAALCEKD